MLSDIAETDRGTMLVFVFAALPLGFRPFPPPPRLAQICLVNDNIPNCVAVVV